MQRAFLDDKSLLKLLFCTRRGSKSYSMGLDLVGTCLAEPKANTLFIGLTRESAKNIMWKDILHDINDKYKLRGHPNKSELSMTFPNGSVFRITGADAHEDEMKKLLGGKYRKVGIDEGSMYTIDLRNLVYGILKPATADPNIHGERGSIVMGGTSSDFARGLFFDITQGLEPGWSIHEWSALDNPHVATQWAEELEDIRTNRPLYMETPQYKQWYLNQWTVDENKLVYRFNPDRNLASALPIFLDHTGWTFVLGADLGWEDDNALVLTAYHVHDPSQSLYVIKCFHEPKLEFDEVIAEIQKFMADPGMSPHKVVIDGANKQGVESMRARSSIPFEYADKVDKVTFIELLNSDLVQGKIKFLPGTEDLQKELKALVWVTEGDKIKYPKKEHPKLPNHLCDAFLYAWRMGYHFQAQGVSKEPPRFSKAWYEQQSNQIWEREREQLERQNIDWPLDDQGWGNH